MDKILISILIIVFLALVGVVGDFFIKLAGIGPKYIELKYFIIGFVIYALTAFGWFYVMKNIKLSVLGVFYAISTVLFLIIVGVFYFKENLNFVEIIGIILAIISFILLARVA